MNLALKTEQFVKEFNDMWLVGVKDKTTKTRLKRYQEWLNRNNFLFSSNVIDLNDYKSYLLKLIDSNSVGPYLSAVRKRYQEFLAEAQIINTLYDNDLKYLEKAKILQEMRSNIQNNLSIKLKSAAPTRKDLDFNLRILTDSQIKQLLRLPDVDTLIGLRDIAIIATFLCTGIREKELAVLEVKDLNHIQNDQRGINIKNRFVPYGELDWFLNFVNLWLKKSNITSGYVFSRVFKGGQKAGKEPLTSYAIQTILKRYSIRGADRDMHVTACTLRRTYARRCFDNGMFVYQIQKNMGVPSYNALKKFIGITDEKHEMPPNIYKDILEGNQYEESGDSTVLV